MFRLVFCRWWGCIGVAGRFGTSRRIRCWWMIDLSLDTLRERARQLRAQTTLNLAPTLSRLEKAGYCPGGRLKL